MSPLSILYVEDNDDLREIIGTLFEGEDRSITSCATAEDALGLMAGRRFDVLVTDVSLPGISGTELARRLLQQDPEHWVVLCSGYEFRIGLDTLGPNVRALLKPFDIEEFDRLLVDVQASRRRAEATAGNAKQLS